MALRAPVTQTLSLDIVGEDRLPTLLGKPGSMEGIFARNAVKASSPANGASPLWRSGFDVLQKQDDLVGFSSPDRRRRIRYPIRRDALIQAGEELIPPQVAATTVDISSAGVLFLVRQDFRIGDQIRFTITLLPAYDAGVAVHLKGRGTVVRVDAGHSGDETPAPLFHVAVSMSGYEFIREHRGASHRMHSRETRNGSG